MQNIKFQVGNLIAKFLTPSVNSAAAYPLPAPTNTGTGRRVGSGCEWEKEGESWVCLVYGAFNRWRPQNEEDLNFLCFWIHLVGQRPQIQTLARDLLLFDRSIYLCPRGVVRIWTRGGMRKFAPLSSGGMYGKRKVWRKQKIREF